MKIHKPVIVLGAGASHGAKLEGNETPPLDADFLSVAAGLLNRLHPRGENKERVTAWKNFKRHLKSAGLEFEEVKSWRLEQLSTFLEARSGLKGLQLSAGRPREYVQALEALKVIVCHVLLATGGDGPCRFHRMLIDAVKPKAILTFNYDLIVDQTLLQVGKLNWRNYSYRGAKVVRVPSKSGGSYFKPLKSSKMRGSIPLIKLHGSIHWEKLRRGEGHRLSGVLLPESGRERFEVQAVSEHPYLIPPVAAKVEIKDRVLRNCWYAAVAELHDVPTWIIWGYSFPQTDTISQVLFRTALVRNRKPKRVVVVNPDQSVSTRVEEVCRKVRVSHFASIESLLFDMGVLANGE